MPNPSNAEHARLSPSASSRWLNCPSSIILAEQLRAQPGYIEPPTGAAAEDGRRMHSLAEAWLRGDPDAQEGHSAEDIDLVRPYVEHAHLIQAAIIDADGAYSSLIEERLNTRISDCWGTCDLIVYSANTNEVWIIDLKTGHQRVSPEENTQLGIYAMGWITSFASSHHLDDETKFHFQIVQPRDEEQPIKTWTTNRAWILGLRSRVRAARVAVDQLDNGAEVEPRLGEWCAYCPAAANCPAMLSRAVSVFDGQSHGSPPSELIPDAAGVNPEMRLEVPVVMDITPTQVAFFLRNAATIKSFLDACEERALSEPIPGFKVVEARTRRRWANPEAVVQELVQQGRNDLLRTQPPTIGDAERVLGRSHAVITTFAVAPPGVPTVAPDSDPRPALDRARVFRVESSEGA